MKTQKERLLIIFMVFLFMFQIGKMNNMNLNLMQEDKYNLIRIKESWWGNSHHWNIITEGKIAAPITFFKKIYTQTKTLSENLLSVIDDRTSPFLPEFQLIIYSVQD